MLGTRLSEERRRLKLSQEQVAHYLGVGRSAVAMIESGRSGLDTERLFELGKKIPIDTIYVATGEHSRQAGARLLDWTLVESILKAIDRWATMNHVVLPPEKITLILKILYHHFAEKGVVDAARVEETLRLAA